MIKNFTRPLNLDDLKDDLQKYGKYGEFWMDKFRTMCLVSVFSFDFSFQPKNLQSLLSMGWIASTTSQ